MRILPEMNVSWLSMHIYESPHYAYLDEMPNQEFCLTLKELVKRLPKLRSVKVLAETSRVNLNLNSGGKSKISNIMDIVNTTPLIFSFIDMKSTFSSQFDIKQKDLQFYSKDTRGENIFTANDCLIQFGNFSSG